MDDDLHDVDAKLVGMYAFLVKDYKILAKTYIISNPEKGFYLLQVIDGFGEPGVARLVPFHELRSWYIIPTKELAEEIAQDYIVNGWRYSTAF